MPYYRLAEASVVLLVAVFIPNLVRNATRSGPQYISSLEHLAERPAITFGPINTNILGHYAFVVGFFTLPFLSIRVGSITLSDICFLVSLGGIVLNPLIRRPALGQGLIVGAWVFLIAAMTTTLIASPTLASLLVIARLAYLTVIWLFLGVQYIRTPHQATVAAAAWCLGAASNGVIVGIDSLSAIHIPFTFESYGRFAGLTQHPNDLGGTAAIVFPVVVALARSVPPSRVGLSRWIFRVAVALVGISIILSGSVTAAVSAIVGCVIYLAALPSAKGAHIQISPKTPSLFVAIAIVFVFAITGSVADFGNSSIGRGLTLLEGRDTLATGNTVESRTDQYPIVFQATLRSPFVGRGLDPSNRRILTHDGGAEIEVHAFVLRVLYEVGILGMVGMIMIEGSLLRQATRLIRTSSGSEQHLASGLLGAMSAGLLLGLGQPLLYQRYFWVPAVFVVALRSLQFRKSKERVRNR